MYYPYYPLLGAEIISLLQPNPVTMIQSAQTTILLNHHKALGLSHSKMKW